MVIITAWIGSEFSIAATDKHPFFCCSRLCSGSTVVFILHEKSFKLKK